MKKSSLKSMMILALSALLVSCGGTPAGTFVIPSDVPYGLGGRHAKSTYRALLATSVGNLNYLETSESTDAQHFANFVDGLLLHNEFGVLEKNLASKVTTNENFTKFTFTVREGVKWVKHDGTQYNAIINGQEVPQFVEPEDFLTSAKEISTFSNESNLQYLIGMFVSGAEEYYQYTSLKQKANEGDKATVNLLKDNQKTADKLNELIETNSPTVYDQVYAENPITADDVPNIVNGNRFGVRIDAENRTVTYDLIMSASYFPTLFTYSCYLPINKHFLKETKWGQFGTDNTKILYCGPYLLDSFDEKQATYVKNPEYWANTDEDLTNDIYILDQILYKILPSQISNDYTRKEFEEGRIDGFGISSKDAVGWKKYITGEDGTGTMENPVDPRVNARLLDTIGNMYGTNIVMGRDKAPGGTKSFYSGGSAESVKNTARALSIKEVREAVMASLDYEAYMQRYGEVEIEQTQMMVHTYVPKGFVINANGEDYVEGNYLPYYAEQKGLEVGSFENPVKGTAAWNLAPGQYESRYVDQAGMNALVEKAEKAIALYNQDSNHTPITYPINIEYYSMWYDATTQTEDKKVIPSMNLRLNKGSSTNSIFNVVATDLINESNYEECSHGGTFDYAAVQWGWGADYGDPLTFMNTYRKGGDWADIFPFVGFDECDNYELSADGTSLEWSDLLGEYTRLVAEGAAETEDINARYDLFAEAEYLLLEELQFYKPMVNYGQGWSVSISLAAGYLNPTASFGLAEHRMTGLYVLTMDDMFDREDRIAARAQHEADKAAYLEEVGSSINIYD